MKRTFPKSFLSGADSEKPSSGTLGQIYISTDQKPRTVSIWDGQHWQLISASDFDDGGTKVFSGDVLPQDPDTYDIGSGARPWRKAYINEISSVSFSEETVQLIGGWFIIPKDAGTLASPVWPPDEEAEEDDTIDFGKAMTVGDWVLIKSEDFEGTLRTEYIEVSTLVEGTTYKVTRDLADAHDPNPVWGQGTPFLVLGSEGDGRIELNAYDTPRIQIIEQGNAYNSITERLRQGDLNGWGPFVTQSWGWAVGNYSGGEYAYYSPTTGMVISGEIAATTGTIGGWEITATEIKSVDAGAGIVLDSDTPSIEVSDGIRTRVFIGDDGDDYIIEVKNASNEVIFSSKDAGASSPSLAGWEIDSEKIAKNNVTLHSNGYILLGTGENIARLDADNATYRLWIGGATDSDAPFSVTKEGAIKSTSGEIGGWDINENSIASTDDSIVLDPVTPSISIGAVTAYMTGIGIWMGEDVDTKYKMHIGDPLNDHLYWDGENLHITGEYEGSLSIDIIDTLGTENNSFTINSYGEADVNSQLIMEHHTANQFYLLWNGTIATMNRPFSPNDLIINRITDTEPVTTHAGMVWLHPSG